MDLSQDYSRVGVFGRGGSEDDGSSRDPELEEEFLSRDWPEVSKPMKGTKLIWKGGGEFSGGVSYGGHLSSTGPRWYGTPQDNPYHIQYEIWAERKFVEQWPDSDYYDYQFNGKIKFLSQGKFRSKRMKPQESKSVAYGDTLAEAQKICEDHFQENFG
jgi:hypothetical protein